MARKNSLTVGIGVALMLVLPLSQSAVGRHDAESIDTPEKQLLELVNRARAEKRVPPLAWDGGLARAARAHALAMAAAHELSHQLGNEPSLPARLTAASTLRMDAEGENVAIDVTLEGAHQGLMHSPPHRENILDSRFNYAGFATVWDKGQLWVVEDFAHAMHNYSTQDAEDLVAKAIEAKREQAKRPVLRRLSLDWLRDVACGMAHADSLHTSDTRNLSHKYTVVAFTQTDPAVLPVSKLPERPDIHDVSLAVCFAKTNTYPGGAYWVIVLFY